MILLCYGAEDWSVDTRLERVLSLFDSCTSPNGEPDSPLA